MFLTVICSAGFLFAQKTVISGVAPGAERKIIRISSPGDLITFWEKTLATSTVDSTGHFSLAVNLEKTINASISIDFHNTEMFLEPSKTYDIRIAPMKYHEYTEVNPFIQSQNLTLDTVNRDPQELNNLIGEFNAIYSGFLMENFNALYHDRRKMILDTFRVELNNHFGAVKNSYFVNYALYKIASLEQLTQYFNQSQLARKYFTDKPVLYNNVEYMDFFNSFFSKYLTVTSKVLHKIDFAGMLKGPDPYKAFMKAMSADTLLKGEQLRELVMLKGLMEWYNSPSSPQEELLGVIRTTQERTKYQENRLIAENIIQLLTKLKPGTTAPEFTLPDRNQKDLSLKSLKGKPVVLCFWTTYCDACLSEMDLIGPLFDKYRENVHFVSISADKYFSKMQYFISLKKDWVWTFLNIGDQSDVLKEYEVRSYPLYVLIDREGKIYKYPAGQPGNGLEEDLLKILEK